jgi:hypothetical protein
MRGGAFGVAPLFCRTKRSAPALPPALGFAPSANQLKGEHGQRDESDREPNQPRERSCRPLPSSGGVACACRAGNTYQNILSRKLNFDYLNLGFAGACRAEPAVIDYICTLDMPLLVFDYGHNAKSADYLQETHLPALRKLRAAHPDIPFVVMSRPDQDSGEADTIRRAKLIEENCRILREESDAPVHFVNGIDIFHSHDKDMMTIDGTHPTDLGFYCMAQALYKVLEQYFP